MRKQFWAINLLLLVSAGGLGWKLHSDWQAYATHNAPESLKLRPPGGVSAPGAAAPRDYAVIAQQNPFHPDRSDAVPQTEQLQAAGSLPLIYGSVILGNNRFALLATEGMPKPQKVAEGEVFNGYRVAQVLPQSIVLESEAGKNEVMLYNAMERLRREHTRTQPTTTSPAAPAVTSTGGATVAAPATAPVVGTGAAPQPAQAAPAGPPRPGKRIMQTPFGPIWVDQKP